MATRPKHILVVVPGLLGSKLRRKNGTPVWGDFHATFLLSFFDPKGWAESIVKALRFSNKLEAYALMDEVAPFLPFPGNQQYSRLIKFLTEELGYVDGLTAGATEFPLFTFPYDWRQDNRISAQQLKAKIAEWCTGVFSDAEVYILAHSQGGVVARWYIEKEGGNSVVTKLMLLGSPWDGTMKAFATLERGPDPDNILLSLFGDLRQKIANAMRTFPGMYQLMPHKTPTLFFEDGSKHTLFTNDKWIRSPAERELLKDAKKFNEELPETISGTVTVVRYVGKLEKPPTLAGFDIDKTSVQDFMNGKPRFEKGDVTITATSAEFGITPPATSVTAMTPHADIYTDTAVKSSLRAELTDQPLAMDAVFASARDIAVTIGLSVEFLPSKKIFAPDELIPATVTLTTNDNSVVDNVEIQVTMEWLQSLPTSTGLDVAPEPQFASIQPDPKRTNRLIVLLNAPQTEGFYEITAEVQVDGSRLLTLREVITVEKVTRLL